MRRCVLLSCAAPPAHACMYAAVSGALRVPAAHLWDCWPVCELLDALPNALISQHVAAAILEACTAQHNMRQRGRETSPCVEDGKLSFGRLDVGCVCCSASPSACVCLSRTSSNAHCCTVAALVLAAASFRQKCGCLPYAFRIWQAMLLKPHWGASGVPCHTHAHTRHACHRQACRPTVRVCRACFVGQQHCC